MTLELGGKSPAIVAPGYPVEKAAARILAGKCLNAGQTCIAPDYVFLPAGQEQAFIDAARRDLGWVPTTDTDTALRKTIEYYVRLESASRLAAVANL